MFHTSEQAQGWLFTVMGSIGDGSPTDPVMWLAEVIGQADYMNHDIIGADEMQEGARRLIDRGLLAIRPDGFTLGLTADGAGLYEEISSANSGVVDRVLAFTSWFEEHGAPPPASTWQLDEQLHRQGLDHYRQEVTPS